MSARALVTTLLAAALAAPAGAQTVFTSRSAFDAASAAQSLTSSTIDFSAQAPFTTAPTILANNFSAGGVTFSARSVNFGSGDVANSACITHFAMNGFAPSFYDWGTGAVYSPQGFGQQSSGCTATSRRSTISLAMGSTRAFGIEYGMINFPGTFPPTGTGTLAATFFNGNATLGTFDFAFTGTTKQFQFFGFLSTAAFDRVDLSFNDAGGPVGSGRIAIFDNVTTGVGAAVPPTVPEPSTVGLLVAGVAGLLATGAHRRRAAA
jgi:hypothetical protein